MRTKAILTSILLATTALAGVASADPMYQPYSRSSVRDHRGWGGYNRNYNVGQYGPRTSRPSWMPYSYSNGYYGYQVDNDGDEVTPYQYGQDPYVEGIARGEWSLLGGNIGLQVARGGSAVLDMGGRPMRSIEVQATRGSSYVGEVHVELMNGEEIKLAPRRQLDDHAPNLRLDLGDECSVGVRRIEIFGQANSAGLVRVLGA